MNCRNTRHQTRIAELFDIGAEIPDISVKKPDIGAEIFDIEIKLADIKIKMFDIYAEIPDFESYLDDKPTHLSGDTATLLHPYLPQRLIR